MDKSAFTKIAPKRSHLDPGPSGMTNTKYKDTVINLDTPKKDREAIEKAHSPSGRGKAPGSTRV